MVYVSLFSLTSKAMVTSDEFPKVSNTLNVSVCNPLLSRGRGYMNSPSGISLSAIGL